MKRLILPLLLSLLAFSGFADQTVLKGAAAIAKFPARLQNSDIAHLTDASWCELMPGVEYFYGRFDKLYNTTANDVSFYRIDYANAPVRMKFVDNRRNGGSNKQTSYVANKYNALFGINCTFPGWYAKMEGSVVNNGNKEGGLALNDDKTFEFFRSSWWSTHPNADDLLKSGDFKIAKLTAAADGSYTLSVTLGNCKNLADGNGNLLMAALGVTGAYGLGSERPFSTANVDVLGKAVGADAVELKAVPKPVDEASPRLFFFRATAR